MLEFPHKGELSKWIQRHSIEQKIAIYRGDTISYHVLEDDANPETPVFFGSDNGDRFYVSSSIPENVREPIVILEYFRRHRCTTHTYREALLATSNPGDKNRKLLLRTLHTFLSALATHMEDTQHGNVDITEDIHNTLALISQKRSKRKAA